MNKYQEALEILCTYADGNPSSSGEFVGKMLQEANDTLQELVEKATPKKAKVQTLYVEYQDLKLLWFVQFVKKNFTIMIVRKLTIVLLVDKN